MPVPIYAARQKKKKKKKKKKEKLFCLHRSCNNSIIHRPLEQRI